MNLISYFPPTPSPDANEWYRVVVAPWIINDYYRDFCYEDDEVDIMKYLVDAAVHPDWGASDAAVDLIIQITVRNISIKSLMSLCHRLKGALEEVEDLNAKQYPLPPSIRPVERVAFDKEPDA